MNNKIISIIIPIYNRAAYLDRCITSSLNQDGVSTEIILVDDGSTDDSLSICQSYAKLHSNIKVILQDNNGLSSARNTGLNQATGEYIFFQDSDDCLVDNTLRVLFQALETHNADYVIGNFERVSETGAFISESHMPEEIKNRLLSEDDFWKYAEPDASYLLFVTVWGKLFKRKIWDTLRFPNVRFAEDEFILPSIVSQCSRIFVSDCVVYRQTISDSSLVRSPYTLKKLDVPLSKLKTADYLYSKDNYSFALKKAEKAIADTCYASIKLRSELSAQEFKCIFSHSRNIYKKMSHFLTLKKKLKLFLFSYCPRLYISITHLRKH